MRVTESAAPRKASRYEASAAAMAHSGAWRLPQHGKQAIQAAAMRQIQRSHGNHEVQRLLRTSASTPFDLHRLSLDDVIPDVILNPIKALVGQVTVQGDGLSQTADSAADGGKKDVDTAAAQAGRDVGTQVAAEQADGGAAAARAHVQVAGAEVAGQSAQATGAERATQLQAAVPAAEYASDPVAPAVKAPPAVRLPGSDAPVAPTAAPEAWNCDEASVLGRVSTVGKDVIQRLSKLVRSVVPEQVLQFAEQGITNLRSALGSIRQKVDAARQSVSKWIDEKLAPVRELARKAEQAISEKVEAAKKAISENIAQARAAATEAWNAVKNRVTSAVNGAIDAAKRGASRLMQRARDLAGRFWDMLPDTLKGPLAGAAAALAAPIALAYKAVEGAVGWVERKASWLKDKLKTAADGATRWFAEKYKAVRTAVANVGKKFSDGAAWVRRKTGEVGQQVYAAIDKLSGGRVSKWRAAAAARLAELKGDVCAVTGEVAGPCVERFLPEPVGSNGKSFANLTLKSDITVPIEGVPVKITAGAKVTIERGGGRYTVILSGDGFAGVAKKLGGGAPGSGGTGGTSGSVTVDGSLPNRALAMLSLSGRSPGMPGVPIPVGGANKPAPAAPGPAPAGGGVDASVEAGIKLSVALSYVFDADPAKSSTCDGLGGLTAFLATQGAAALLPAPFSNLAAAGGQAAFADKLTSAKVTYANTGTVDLKGSAGPLEGKASLTASSGASLEARTEVDKSKSITLTLFQSLSGEGALSFAPDGIGMGKVSAGLGGRQELAIVYNITRDALDAGFKQTLSGSVGVATFGGMIASLPPALAAAIRRRLACLPDVNEASVAFELSNNIAHLAELAAALDQELDKGAGATASGVWEAVSHFVKNPANAYVEFSATLTLTEKVLGVKAKVSADDVSGSAELGISRGQQIVLCPPTRLFQGGGAALPEGPRCDTPLTPVQPDHQDPGHKDPGLPGPLPQPRQPDRPNVPHPRIPIEQARRQVQQSSEQIRELVRQRALASDADKARIDAEIAHIQQQRQQSLMTVVMADNPQAQVVDAARGIYRMRMVDAEGNERFLYGSLEVVWQLAQVSPSVFQLGAQLQSRPPQPDQLPPGTSVTTQMAVGGSGIQGQAQPFPGDIDFAETFDVVAPDARSAATATYQTIVEFVQRNSARADIEFERLIITGGPRQGYTQGALLDPARKEELIQQLAGLRTANGNVNTFWRARVADGRFIEVTKILSIHALSSTSGDQLFGTRPSFGEFQQASFEEPGQIPAGNLGAFADLMRAKAKEELGKGHFLKAAKRGFNFCMATGNLAGMDALRPVFQTDEAQVNQQTAGLAAIADALDPAHPSRILSRDEAQQLTRTAARSIETRLGAGDPRAKDIAARLRRLADAMQATAQGLLQVDPQQQAEAATLVTDADRLLNEGLRSRVVTALERFVF
jgi:hypothetical protein